MRRPGKCARLRMCSAKISEASQAHPPSHQGSRGFRSRNPRTHQRISPPPCRPSVRRKTTQRSISEKKGMVLQSLALSRSLPHGRQLDRNPVDRTSQRCVPVALPLLAAITCPCLLTTPAKMILKQIHQTRRNRYSSTTAVPFALTINMLLLVPMVS